MNLKGLDEAESDFLRVGLRLTGGRRCAVCLEAKGLEDFPGSAKAPNGSRQCKTCRAAIMREERGHRPAYRAGAGFVYRFFDADGRLLYAGLTRHPAGRFYGSFGMWSTGAHATAKEWWSDVAEISVSSFATYEDARLAEAWAIRLEAPLHNVNRPSTEAGPCPSPISTISGAPLPIA